VRGIEIGIAPRKNLRCRGFRGLSGSDWAQYSVSEEVWGTLWRVRYVPGRLELSTGASGSYQLASHLLRMYISQTTVRLGILSTSCQRAGCAMPLITHSDPAGPSRNQHGVLVKYRIPAGRDETPKPRLEMTVEGEANDQRPTTGML
jgi:hypothetical protein